MWLVQVQSGIKQARPWSETHGSDKQKTQSFKNYYVTSKPLHADGQPSSTWLWILPHITQKTTHSHFLESLINKTGDESKGMWTLRTFRNIKPLVMTTYLTLSTAAVLPFPATLINLHLHLCCCLWTDSHAELNLRSPLQRRCRHRTSCFSWELG